MGNNVISQQTRLAIKLHTDLVEEGCRRIGSYRPSKFDRMQFEEALAGDHKKQIEVTRDIEQKIMGPDFTMKSIKTMHVITKELASVSLQEFSLYVHETQPYFIAMHLALVDRVRTLIRGASGYGNDPDSFLSSD